MPPLPQPARRARGGCVRHGRGRAGPRCSRRAEARRHRGAGRGRALRPRNPRARHPGRPVELDPFRRAFQVALNQNRVRDVPDSCLLRAITLLEARFLPIRIAMKNNPLKTGFGDRHSAAQEAKTALLAKFKPKPMVTDTRTPADRAAEREALRQQRAAEKVAQRLADEEAERQRQIALLNDDQYQLELKRKERKDRKAQAKQEAQERREQKRAAYAR